MAFLRFPKVPYIDSEMTRHVIRDFPIYGGRECHAKVPEGDRQMASTK
jgi:hypothetical protein